MPLNMYKEPIQKRPLRERICATFPGKSPPQNEGNGNQRRNNAGTGHAQGKRSNVTQRLVFVFLFFFFVFSFLSFSFFAYVKFTVETAYGIFPTYETTQYLYRSIDRYHLIACKERQHKRRNPSATQHNPQQ